MPYVLPQYLPVLVFIIIAGVIAMAMVGGSLLAARQKPYPEKLSAYECGFEAFDDARRRFDVRYYLVAILFIIFDLEVAFLFPWAVSPATHGCSDSCPCSASLAFSPSALSMSGARAPWNGNETNE